MKRCPTPRGGRSMIRSEAALFPVRAPEEPGMVSSISRLALILRTCSETLIFSGSRHTPSTKGILRATFNPAKRHREATSRILSTVTCSICFLTSSHLTNIQMAVSFTVHPTSSAATPSPSAQETW